jgi:hypothetical protein
MTLNSPHEPLKIPFDQYSIIDPMLFSYLKECYTAKDPLYKHYLHTESLVLDISSGRSIQHLLRWNLGAGFLEAISR